LSSPASDISIVIPCYNAARFLRQAIESALTQTYPAREVIVVDDGSTDDSAEIAESYGEKVRVIRQHNQGQSIARNVGTAASKGDYLLYLDADDLLAVDALKVLAAAVTSQPDCVAVMGVAVFEDDPTRPTRINTESHISFLPAILSANIRNPICWLTPRSWFDRVGGFYGPTSPFDDWDFWARIGLGGARLVCVSYVGALYRRHDAAMMSTIKACNRAIGHAMVVERMSRQLLENEELLQAFGKDMFWSACSALHNARSKGVSWRKLRPLREAIRELIRRGPENVRQLKFAKMMRWLGVPLAEAARNVLLRNGDAKQGVGSMNERELRVDGAA
jgi:glycosyltransferase involved in cell wall biosynthesis